MESQQPGADALATQHGTAGVVHELVDRIADSANVRAVYGEPIDRNGTTVIPVAHVRYGFGGGSGRQPAKGQEGTGAGGGVRVTPVGYVEMCEGKVRFRPIRAGSTLMRALGIGVALMFAREIVRVVSQRRRVRTLRGQPATKDRAARLTALIGGLPEEKRRHLVRRLRALRRS
jgi:uncharacterized spore protein YtfJ